MPKGTPGSASGYDHTSHGDPWGQQPDESKPAYDAFLAYRDMGYTRSYRATAAKVQKARSLIDRWGKQWFWQGRAAAWDSELAKQDAATQIQQQKEARKRHADIAKGVQVKVIQRLKTLKVDELKPNELIRWLDVATRIEREALGMTGYNVGVHMAGGNGFSPDAPDVSGLSPEETTLRLRQLIAEGATRLSERGVAAPRGYEPAPAEDDDIEDAEIVHDESLTDARA